VGDDDGDDTAEGGRMTNREVAIRVIRTLQGKGFEALLAGGCVRDMLLRRLAKDYDVATDARPRDVARLFRRTLKVGAKFGVVIVLMGARQVEVATFRSDKRICGRQAPRRPLNSRTRPRMRQGGTLRSTGCSMTR